MSFQKKSIVITGRDRVQQPSESNVTVKNTRNIRSNLATRPSLQTSHACISSGAPDLDSLLGHGGIPLGSILLVEESGTTNFGSALLRSFAAQGIVHDRLPDKKASSKVFVVGVGSEWGQQLPGLYDGNKSRNKFAEDKAKVTVENMTSTVSTPSRSNRMKISWRYAQEDKESTLSPDVDNIVSSNEQEKLHSGYPSYASTFDFTSRLKPPPSRSEISYLVSSDGSTTSSAFVSSVIPQLQAAAEEAVRNATIVRVVFPSLLHPSVSETWCEPSTVIPLVQKLQSLCRKYPENIAVMMSLPLALFPRTTSLTRWLELLVDACIHIEGFPDEVEKDGKSNDSKPLQGLISIYKLPMTSERGMMVTRVGEHAFRLGSKKFEIQEWGIPVDVGPEKETAANSLDY